MRYLEREEDPLTLGTLLEQEEEEVQDPAPHQYYQQATDYTAFHHPLPTNANSFPPFLSEKPELEYFGPKDYVPESPHLIVGGNIQLRPQHAANIEHFNFPSQKQFLRLEPKPR